MNICNVITCLGTLAVLALAVVILIKVNKKGGNTVSLSQNPGCDPLAQKMCTVMGRSGVCGGPHCCPCDDWEGERCVPRECADSACRNGKCNA